MKKWAHVLVGVALALALLWWMFSGTDWKEVFQAIRGVNPWWITLALAAIMVSFFTRVQRWSYIVRTAHPASFREMFSATQIGFLANFVLPARAGELIRALALGRLTRLPFGKCLAFVALDRVTDIFGLVAVLIVSALAFHPVARIVVPEGADFPVLAEALLEPAVIQFTTMAAVAGCTGLVACFVVLYLNQGLVLRISDALLGRVSQTLAQRVHHLIVHFSDGLHIFRSFGDMAKSVSFSLVTWALFVVAYGAIMLAFHLAPPWYAPFILLSLLAAAISMPGAPGFVGQFHAAIYASLFITMPQTDPDVARAMAIVAHLLNLIPVAAIGLYCLWKEDLGLLQLQRESETIQADETETQEGMDTPA